MRKNEEQDRCLPLGYYTRAHPVTKLYIPIIHRASLLQTVTTVRLAPIGGSPQWLPDCATGVGCK